MIHSRDVKFNEIEKSGETESESDSITIDDNVRYPVMLDSSSDDQNGSQTTTESVIEQQLSRSTRERRQPDYYSREQTNLSLSQEPATYEEATTSSHKSRWKKAMNTEMESLKDNDVWDLVELPAGKRVVGSKWVFKIKTGADGSIERYKARLVAQGYTRFGTDYDETFCPVVRQESLRVLIALSAKCGLKLHQVDVTTAFLNSTLQEEVYMTQPEGFITGGQEELVCKLKKNLYGLKQSPRCWNTALDAHLKNMGFTQSNSDPCIYYRGTEESMFYMGVYVDDIVIAGRTVKEIEQVKSDLSKKFNIKDMGKLHHFLGMTVLQDEENGSVWIGQPAYTENLLAWKTASQ